MRVTNIIATPLSIDSSTEAVKASLERLATLHRVSVPELLQSAKAAGPGGPEYLVRASNLERRIERLEAKQ